LGTGFTLAVAGRVDRLGLVDDVVPEAIALGAAFAHGESTGALLAILIGLQNLPEGFNSFRELKAKGDLSDHKIVWLLCALVPLGPLAGWVGYSFLAEYPKLVGFIMLFAASGILYLTFQDLAPQSQTGDRDPRPTHTIAREFLVLWQGSLGSSQQLFAASRHYTCPSAA